MSFTEFPISIGDSIQDRTPINQIIAAINERAQALTGSTSYTARSAGDSAQASIAGFQQWIETNCGSFVQSHDSNGDAFSPAQGHFNDKAAITMWTLSNLREAAGLHADGFTRRTSTNDLTYGLQQAGDAIILANLNEMWQCLKLLLWTREASVLWTNKSEQNQRSVGPLTRASWAQAKADTLLSFDDLDPFASGDLPHAWGQLNNPSENQYQATLSRGYQYLRIQAISRPIASTVDAYVFTKIPALGDASLREWNANGDGMIEDKYKFIAAHSVAADTALDNDASKIGRSGTGEYPAWPAEPTEEAKVATAGYRVDGGARVRRWSFSYV